MQQLKEAIDKRVPIGSIPEDAKLSSEMFYHAIFWNRKDVVDLLIQRGCKLTAAIFRYAVKKDDELIAYPWVVNRAARKVIKLWMALK